MKTVSRAVLPACLAAVLCAGCATAPESSPIEGRHVVLDLGGRATDEIVQYYLASYLTPEPADPFESGVLIKTGDGYAVLLDSLSFHDARSAEVLEKAGGEDRELDWEEFVGFVDATYARARRLPQTFNDLASSAGFQSGSPDWMTVDVIGVMSTSRRRVSVRKRDLVDAVASFGENGDRLLYPDGTIFIVEQFDGDRIDEVTAMQKRADGFWDFIAYDAAGSLVSQTLPRPRALQVPTQCVGCHHGSKLYEPEKSFPSTAADGPHGPRAIFVDDAVRNRAVARFFDEHLKRSDHVLGVYATLLVSRLLSDRSAGVIDSDSASLLAELDL